MNSLGELKPILTTLLLPPASLLLLGFLGLLLAARRKAAGLLLIFLAGVALWLLSCHAVSVWLAHTLLPQHAPVTAAAVKSGGVQAIVVLGGGVPNGQVISEGEVARRAAQQDYGLALRWIDTQSRDTVENAQFLKPLMEKDKVQRIALVTHAWHMPRSVRAFERAGFIVTPAPMGFILPSRNGVLQWTPSADGLGTSQLILKEWLGLLAQRFT